jgi:TRAP-type C4-dicarboxylate transport system substrate-binding protein
VKITKRQSLAAACLTLAAIAFQTAPSQAATTWECYVYNPVATQPSVAAVINMANEIKEQTHGDLAINVHLGGSLPIKADGITAGVQDGVIQFGDDGFATGTIPVTGILHLPLLIQNETEMKKALDLVRPYLDSAYGKRGIEVLGQYYYPVQVIWGKKKIESLADIKGLKLRVTSVEQGEFVRRFGGVPLTMGSPDVAAALDRGVVDGAFTASSGGGIPWHDLLKYRYAFPTSWVNSTYIVNKDAMKALPEATQKIVRDSAAKWATWASEEMDRQEDKLTKEFGQGGMVLTDAKPEEIKEATDKMRPYWDDWSKHHPADADEALKKLRAMVGR